MYQINACGTHQFTRNESSMFNHVQKDEKDEIKKE